jgi:hypothetical protein
MGQAAANENRSSALGGIRFLCINLNGFKGMVGMAKVLFVKTDGW